MDHGRRNPGGRCTSLIQYFILSGKHIFLGDEDEIDSRVEDEINSIAELEDEIYSIAESEYEIYPC
jgi:hypothetical protein